MEWIKGFDQAPPHEWLFAIHEKRTDEMGRHIPEAIYFNGYGWITPNDQAYISDYTHWMKVPELK